MTKVTFKSFFIHILLIIPVLHVISADNKSLQGRQPNKSNLYPAGLAAVEQIMQHLIATGESLHVKTNGAE